MFERLKAGLCAAARLRRDWPTASRPAIAIGVAVAAGLCVGWLLLPHEPSPADDTTPLPAVQFLGKPLPANDRSGKLALERARNFLAGRFQLKLPDGGVREIYLGQLGAELDRVYLASLVREARDRTSALVQLARSRPQATPLPLPLPVSLDRDRALKTLLGLKDELDRAPSDARLDLEKRELVPEVRGRRLDVDASLAAIEAALRRGEPSTALVFSERRPRRLASELGNVDFSQVLGFFETHYDRSQRTEARTYNLRLAASRLDGHVLLPGEVFDFNAVVGPRDEANGYKVAPVIAEGELVDGIGGGTCQISGTLHGAVFFAGLEIVERLPHTRPSSYIKMGLDATVVYPTINFRVRNPFSFPVVLHETVKNGIVRAEVLGPERARTVTFIRRILDVIPYEEIERPDKDLARGERVLSQRGVAGFKLRRYRIVRDGTNAVRERWDDVYPPTSQIVRVGTGDNSDHATKREDDRHPEYLADELLVMTESGDADEEQGGSLVESREPGKYGEPGWTRAAGMPFYESRGSAQAGDGAAERPERTQKTRQKAGKKSRGDKQT